MLNLCRRLASRLGHAYQLLTTRRQLSDDDGNSVEPRILAVFDFDETITAVDSYLAVSKLLPRSDQTPQLSQLLTESGWLCYLRAVLALLQQQCIDGARIAQQVRYIPAMPGMLRLLRQLARQPTMELHILSDSNSYFIEQWLAAYQLRELFAGIHTNPAKLQANGQLQLDAYTKQQQCACCPSNLCKGAVLQELQCSGVYKRTIYVGDGGNDLCGMRQLQPSDMACIRRGHELHKQLLATQSACSIRAELLLWRDGHDLHEQLLAKKAI